ncbi:ribonuclease H protein [Trifolium medium]|uniref:Ribonuclease H protein n=1 Tax=Trifolium medium TaxID=97028 RepID=A0A392NRZ3_9FABA|nr:ribonuclease H protein [Trifolium medium]
MEVRVDSKVVVQTLNNTKGGSAIGWRVIKEISRLLAMDWELNVYHFNRKANSCASPLANMGCEHGPGLRIYKQCPISLSNLLLADAMETTTRKVIDV